MIIRGTITFEAGAPAFNNADLRVRVEDVSETDAQARTVAEKTTHGVTWFGNSTQGTEFALTIPAGLSPRGRYQLRAHLDTTKTGEVSLGDFVTTQAFPLDPVSENQHLNLKLKWLKR